MPSKWSDLGKTCRGLRSRIATPGCRSYRLGPVRRRLLKQPERAYYTSRFSQPGFWRVQVPVARHFSLLRRTLFALWGLSRDEVSGAPRSVQAQPWENDSSLPAARGLPYGADVSPRRLAMPRPTPRRRLLFTSAGAGADLSRWLAADRSFDVWVSYRAQGEPPWSRQVDRFERSSAAKFPAFKLLHAASMKLLSRYDAVFLLDDDIVISPAQIEQLFALRDRFHLWVLQPSYSRTSKISHAITLQDGRGKLRFTNFVEVGVPLFQRSRLDAFMTVYDPALVGYGVDWWYLDHFGPDLSRRVAIVDDVPCVNPARASET